MRANSSMRWALKRPMCILEAPRPYNGPRNAKGHVAAESARRMTSVTLSDWAEWASSYSLS
jgi:hypothetical protein